MSRTALLLLPIALLAACGQAGDLYLPERAPAPAPAAGAPAAPEAEPDDKKD
jgi:predicted small lipoprotein YifL